jgi:hypothetical protein
MGSGRRGDRKPSKLLHLIYPVVRPYGATQSPGRLSKTCAGGSADLLQPGLRGRVLLQASGAYGSLVTSRTSGVVGAPGKDEARMGQKAWMLLWGGVFVFAVLCVYGAVRN